jgi:hypothetical protein
MKFITRKPVNWFGPYQLFSPVEKFLIRLGYTEDQAFDFVHDIVEHIPNRPFELLDKFRRSLPWNKQVVKIDKWDTWNMDTTLAYIVVPMLKQLKETKHGIPCDFAEVGGEDWEAQQCFDFYSEDTNKLFNEKAVARWDEVMDKMIWSFEQIITDCTSEDVYWEPYWEDMDPSEEIDENSVYNQIGIEHPRKKINREKMEEYNRRMSEGFELFGKYYRNLWD